YSEFVDLEERNQFVFAFDEPQVGVAGESAGVDVTRMLEDGKYKNSTFTNTLGADLALGDWLVGARFNRTDTELGTSLPIPRSMGGRAMASYDLRDIEDPIVRLDRDLSSVSYTSTIGLYYLQGLDVRTDKIKLDAERDMNWFGRPATLQIGGQT